MAKEDKLVVTSFKGAIAHPTQVGKILAGCAKLGLSLIVWFFAKAARIMKWSLEKILKWWG